MQGWGTIHAYESLTMIGVYAGYVVLCWKYSTLTERFCSGGKEGIDPEVEDWISSFQAPPSPQQAVAAVAAAAGERSLRESMAEADASAAEQARFTVGSGDDADNSTAGAEHEEEEDAEGHGHGVRDETCQSGLIFHLLTPPDSLRDKIIWAISLPLMTYPHMRSAVAQLLVVFGLHSERVLVWLMLDRCFCLTIIDCRNRRFEGYYMATMLTSICCKQRPTRSICLELEHQPDNRSHVLHPLRNV